MRTDLLEKYSESLPEYSRRKNAARARAYLQFLGKREPSPESVRQWIQKLEDDGYADGSQATDWAIIRRLFKVNGLEWPFRHGDAPVVDESEVFAPALGRQEIFDMVRVCQGRLDPQGGLKPSEYHTTFLCLATVWWLRRVEMKELTPEHVDLKRGTIFISTAKHGRARYHIIPEWVVPYLKWDFRHAISSTALSLLFNDLKTMIGFRMGEVGWHAVRRACIVEARAVDISSERVYRFGRWKRSTHDMVSRYATSRIVTRETESIAVGMEDRDVDLEVYEKHPYVQIWKE